MANLNSPEQKSIEKDFAKAQPNEELDKLNDRYASEGEIPTIFLVLFAIIPMAILIILFSL